MANEPDDEGVAGRLTRREALGAAFAMVSATGSASSTRSFAATMAVPDEAALEAMIPALSNWMRWGKDDQLGTLNLITDEMRVASARLVQSGRVVSLGREVSSRTPKLRNFSYKMISYTDPLPEEAGSMDIVGFNPHGFAFTHVDALCHFFTPAGRDGMYNGYPVSLVEQDGAKKLGIEHVGAKGIVGRGVLLDIAEVRGGPLPLGTPILPADLEAAEKRHGVTVGAGDILFVRNGAGMQNTFELGTGLHAACLPWLKERDVAVLSSDSDSDVHPPIPGFERWSEPTHMVGIAYMGLTLLDNAELDALSQVCASERRWSFLVSVAPWRFKGATGAVVNPLAIL